MLKLAATALVLACARSLVAADLTLEQAMADPDWIGPPVEQAFWAADSKAAYYRVKRAGSPLRDLHRVDVTTGKDVVVAASDTATADGPGVRARAEPAVAFIREGDVFLRDLRTGALTQVTSTAAEEADVGFMADSRFLRFRAGPDWLVYDRAQRVVKQAAVLRLEKDPLAAPDPDDLRDLQLRLFTLLQRERAEKQADAEAAREARRLDPTRVGPTVYLGDEVQIVSTDLSPSGRYLLVVTAPNDKEPGRVGKMPRYVTESGYEEVEDVRTRVGRKAPLGQTLSLVDLTTGTLKPLAYDPLPGIQDDPQKELREAAEKARPKKDEAKVQEKGTDKPKARAVDVLATAWNPDGTQIAIELHAADHKDRWIATVDLDKAVLVTRHRVSDPAWVNWSFNELQWAGRATLLFQSEESGYAHLHAMRVPQGTDQALTSGAFEVSGIQVDADGRFAYAVANKKRPIEYEAYRIDLRDGALTELTDLGGVESLALSPDGRSLLVTHSRSHVPPQLSVVDLATGKTKPLTDTRTARYKEMTWPEPVFVQVPSTHQPQPIWSKLYLPKGDALAGGRPAVLFIHGAGYMQDADLRWSYYFREQFFNHLLASQGYVVLDMDYRASQGYGRDWRTAIYRQMGHPELEDLQDGVAWLAKNQGVDPRRVGLYGGSYGGFLGLMALFRLPGEFAAAAALRPVTDWTSYEQGYTSAILNTPDVDPEAYRVSSPIEYAKALRDPLLIAHGMIDDNVFYQDSVRLTERLIELGKENWELASYPMERHGFRHPESWLDEYRRIHKLFERTIGARP
jgi:dipeptidyl aminopeptidase/acylaminoacyl peptidase